MKSKRFVRNQKKNIVQSLSLYAQNTTSRLSFCALIFFVIWAMVSSQFSKNLYLNDDPTLVRFEQSSETNTDTDSNLNDFPTLDNVVQKSIKFDLTVISTIMLITSSIILLRNVLTQIRPRSPPQ